MKRVSLCAFVLCLATALAHAQAPAEPQNVNLRGVTGVLPAGWKPQVSNGQFRLVQYELPKAAGDPAAPVAIVYYFGRNGAGTVEDNLKRWAGMVRQADGSTSEKVARRAVLERPGLTITTIDVSGTYLDRPAPMAPQAVERPDYRLLGAIVERTKDRTDGPLYIRLVGPRKSVNDAAARWAAFLGSLKAE